MPDQQIDLTAATAPAGDLPITRLLSTREVAALLGVSERTVWTMSHGEAPELPPIRLGRQIRFDPRDVMALLERCKRLAK